MIPGIFRSNSLFIGANCRKAVNEGRADFTPIFLSEIPLLFQRKIIDIDVALIQVSPPDKHGFCTLGPSVDCTRAAIQNAKYIIGMNFYIFMPYTQLYMSYVLLNIYVIHQTGGSYWGKLCPRSWIRYTRQRAQFFPIRTNLGLWITLLFFLKPNKWLWNEMRWLWAGQMGRTLPTFGTNQIAGFVEYCLFTNWEKNKNYYKISCYLILTF